MVYVSGRTGENLLYVVEMARVNRTSSRKHQIEAEREQHEAGSCDNIVG